MEKIKSLFQKYVWVIIIIFGFVVLVWFRGKYILDTLDFAFPYNIDIFFSRMFSIWNTTNSFGFLDARIFANIVPYGIYYKLTELIHLSLNLSQQIFTFIVFVGSGLSMFYLCRVFKANRTSSFIASLVYMFNPFVAVFIWPMRNLFILSYAFIPLAVAQFINLSKKETPSLRDILFHVLTLFLLLTSSFSNPSIFLIYFIPCAVYLFFRWIKGSFISFKIVFLVGLGFLLLSAFWILPVARSVTTELSSASVNVSSTFNDLTSLKANSKNILDAFSLSGFWAIDRNYKGDEYYPWHPILESPLGIFLKYIPILLFSLYLLSTRSSTKKFTLSCLILFSFFMLTGTADILPQVKLYILQHIPILVTIFRSLETKFSPILLLCLAPVLALIITKIYLLKYKKTSIIFGLILLLYVFYLGSPILKGDVIYGGGIISPSTRVSIPDEYESAKNWLGQQTEIFRILPLPISTYSIAAYKWNSGFEGATPDRYLLGKEVLTSNKGEGFTFLNQIGSDLTKNNLTNEDYQTIFQLLGSMNVKYILLHYDTNWDYIKDNKYWLQFTEETLRNIESRSGLKTKVFNNLTFLEIPSEYLKKRIFSFSELNNLDSVNNLDSKFNFIDKKLNTNFYFTTPIIKDNIIPTVSIYSLFENLDFKNISENNIIANNINNINGNINLYIKPNISNLRKYLFLNGQKVSQGIITMNEGVNKFEYKNPEYKFNNIITNPSFENGGWQEKVGDCHNFDKNPILAMSLNKEVKSEGEQSLQLEATRHNACTKIGLNVIAGGSYLFSFDYQSPNADHAMYYLVFNDEAKTVITEDLPIKDKNWNTFSKTIQVPEGATSVSLYVYADSTDEKTNIINRYDNFKLIQVPDLTDAYYLVSEPEVKLIEPNSITFDLINPTKKLVHIKGATTPFFLAMSESYHYQWQLQFNNEKVNGFFNSWVPFVKPDRIKDEYHYKLNDFLNAWYIDTSEYCANNNLCIKNTDGSYDIEMTIEFFPQRWFYLGLFISGTTLVWCLGYLGYEGVKRIRIKIKKNEKDN